MKNYIQSISINADYSVDEFGAQILKSAKVEFNKAFSTEIATDLLNKLYVCNITYNKTFKVVSFDIKADEISDDITWDINTAIADTLNSAFGLNNWERIIKSTPMAFRLSDN